MFECKYTHLDMTKGCVVLIDMSDVLNGGTSSYGGSMPYHMRVDELIKNGITSFLIKGPVVSVLHADGTHYTEEEREEYLATRAQQSPLGMRDLGKETINVSHVVKIIKPGKGALKVISERKPVRTDVPYFSETVYNEAVRFFNGAIPPNLDIHYLARLLERHRRGYTLTWRNQQFSPIFRYTGGVRNVKKFREDFKRNVNRALYRFHDAEMVADLLDQQMYMEDGCVWLCDQPSVQAKERDRANEVFSILSKTWEVFGKGHGRNTRYDVVTRPRSLWQDGKRLPPSVVLDRAFSEVIRELCEAERVEAEKNKQPDDDVELESDYDDTKSGFADFARARNQFPNIDAIVTQAMQENDQQDPLEG